MVWTWAVVGVAGLGLLVVAVTATLGSRLPVHHTVSRRILLSRRREEIWHDLTDVGGFPEWRSRVKGVEILAADQAGLTWRESGRGGRVTLRRVMSAPPEGLVVETADPGLPYRGRWTYRLDAVGSGCTVTVTEVGEVRNVFVRFIIRHHILGFAATIDAMLTDLAAKYGEPTVPGPATDPL